MLLLLALAVPLLHTVRGSALPAAPSDVTRDARGVVPASAVSKSGTPPRYAYVLMHYEGTPKDDEYVLGLRVLIRSIQDTKTPHDIVVILSKNVRESTRAALQADGAKLLEVDNLQNPFERKVEGRNSYKARFVYSFNKLYVWNMTDYERVVFLDSDNIFIDNMDALFHCGHFCVVFMNPLIFHTGLIVVKPDATMFKRLVHALYSDASFSHDGADQGFLVAQFDVEHAPLYLPSEHPHAPSEAPAMRLNIGWNINHFWYYIHFDWDWFFQAPGLSHEYPWMRREYPNGRPSDAVAGSSLAYCSGMMLKPWYWFPTFYFTHHYKWHDMRAELGDNYWAVLLSRVALLAVLVPIVRMGSDRARIDKVTLLDPLRDVALRVFSIAPVLFGYLYGLFAFFLHGYVAFQLIPFTTPPWMAWSIWSLWHVGLGFTHLTLLVNTVLRPTASSMRRESALAEARGAGNATVHSTSEEINAAAASVSGWFALSLFVAAQSIFFVAWADIFPHFIVKIGIFEYLLMGWIGLYAHVFRRATQRMLALRPAIKE